MAFRQYTRCVSPADFTSFSRLARILVVGGFATLVAVVVAVFADQPWGILIGLEIGGLATLIAYCWIWLRNRLICIQDDVEVVGVIASLSPPSRKLGDLDWDNDYSLDLLLQDSPFGSTQQDAEQSQPYGGLAAAHHTLTAIGRQTPGHAAQHKQGSNTIRTYGLHIEFEGRGNRTLQDAAMGSLALAVAGFVACLLDAGAAAAIFSLTGLGITVLAGIIGKYAGAGAPTDVDPNIGTLNPIQLDANGNPLPGADIVYVKGTWVYDALHDGWNEIHPIKVFVKVGTWTGDWKTQPPINVDQVRAKFATTPSGP